MDIEKIFYSYFVQYFLILSSGMVREFPFQIWDEYLSKRLGYRFLKITHWWNLTVYLSKRIVRIFIKIYLKIFLLSCFKNLRAIGFEVLEVEISNLCRSDPYLDHIKFGRRDFVLKFLQIRFFSIVVMTVIHTFSFIFWLENVISVSSEIWSEGGLECFYVKGRHWLDNWKWFWKKYKWGKKLLKIVG